MARSKEACAIVLDVGRSMFGEIENAKKALRLMIQQKLLFTKQDEMGLVLMGTNETANALNEENPDEYMHISVQRDVSLPKLDFLESVDTIDCEDAEADVIDALIVAMKMIIDRVGKYKFTKRIFLITNAAMEIAAKEQIEVICQKLIQEDIKLNIIGVGFTNGEEDELELKLAMDASKGVRTPTQIENEKLLRDLAKKVKGAVFPVHLALDLMSCLRSRSVNQTTTYRGALTIGSMAIDIYAYTKTKLMPLPSLTKLSTVAPESDDKDAGKVKQSRSYWNKHGDVDDPGAITEVLEDDRIRAYDYGKEKIPLAEYDLLEIKKSNETCCKVLGFVKASEIPRHFCMGGTEIIVAEPGNNQAAIALSSLVHACFEKDRVAVVRYCKRSNWPTYIGYLTPMIKTSMEGFYWNQLPFAEDIRDFQFGSFNAIPSFVPSPAQVTAAENLIRSLDLTNVPSPDDETETTEILKPKYTFNPILQRFYQCVERRALDPSAPVSELDPVIKSYLEPNPQVFERSREALQQFKQAFPLKQRESQDKKKRRHWRDLIEDQEASKKSRHDAPEPSIDLDTEIKIEEIVKERVDHVSSADPLGTFTSIMSRRDNPALVTQAINEMWTIIEDSIIKAFRGNTFPKALACLLALREACVREEESGLFNQGLIKLRGLVEKKYSDFWRMMVEKEARPIDSEECPDSEFSPSQAQAFLGGEVVAPEMSPVVSSVDDDSSVFDEME
eukprot:TRINITY_DN6592_c0_g2_i3.p1 TRINITY_DN6592_c0_g2~~TRINITY_DN6592_c0_g2_i3.p1  ORF type:complete len:729 (-),score=150.15 TRINITY_DN6592_c0_g2_i3:21-2207(-)